MSRLLKMFDEVQRRFPNAFITTPERLYNSVFDFKLFERNVIPRIPYENFKAVCRNAIRGDLTDMQLVAMFYAVGFGVPRDETYCMYWSQMSVLDSPCDSVDAIFEKLKQDVRNASSDYVYPQFVFDDRVVVLPKTLKLEEEMFGNRLRIFPIYSGMTLNLVYRFAENTCYLYDAFNNVTDFSLEHLYRLKVPQSLNRFIPDYKTNVTSITNVEPSAMVVSGTLVIPKPLMRYVRERYPTAKSVGELFALFCKDTRPRHTMDSSDKEKLEQRIATLNKQIAKVTSGETANLINSEYKAVYADYVKENTPELADQLRELKTQHAAIKSGETLQTLQAQLTVKIEQLQAFSNESESLHYSYLENVFEFIPNDMYVTNSDGVLVMPLRNNFKSHIQSLGFTTPAEICEYSDSVNIDDLVRKFTNSDYSLRAFNVRRVESVNNKTYTVTLAG